VFYPCPILYIVPRKREREMPLLDRESIAIQCTDIHRNPRISKWISIKAWIVED